MWNSVTTITTHTTLLRLVPQAGQTISLLALRAGDKEPSSTLSSWSGDILIPTFVPHPRDALVLDPVQPLVPIH